MGRTLRARPPAGNQRCVRACTFLVVEQRGGTVRIGVRELRSDLAAFVRRAEGGESVVVTVSGRPAAVLGPVGPSHPANETTLDDLVALGVVVAPRVRSGDRSIVRTRLPVDARSDTELRKLR